MKKSLSIYVACTAFLFSGSVFFSFDQGEQNNNLHEESPSEPYEEFMLQRTYPNATFAIDVYRAAVNDAATRGNSDRSASMVSWDLEGPGNIGGRFNCLVVDPTNSNIMYAGSANGGVWKTTDNAATWLPITDMLPFQAVGAIAINPTNANEVWIGMGDVNISGTMYAGDGVYRSMDAGVTWTYLGLSNTYVVSSIIFNPANTSEVLVGTMGNCFNQDGNRGMYRTTNSGGSFTNTLYLNDSTGVIDLIQNPVSPSTVYATTFSRLRTSSQSLVYGTEVYVYKSTDFGQTWTQLSGGLPNGGTHQRLGVALCDASPNTLYASYSTSDGVTTPGLYKSINGGTTWTQINVNSFDMNSYGSFGWYFGKIYVDPNNANTLYMPGIDLQYSTDGGVNWNLRTPNWWTYEVHADGHHMNFANSNEFIYCTDGGLYRTYDGGNNWLDIENIPNNQFYAVTENPHNVGEYAGGVQDNGTMFGNAAVLNNFTRIYGGDGFTVEYTPDPQLLYTETQGGGIVYDDMFPTGNWQSLDVVGGQYYNWHTPYFVSSHSSSTVFYGGEQVMRIGAAPYGSAVPFSPSLVDPQSPWRVHNISTIHQSDIDSNILYAGTADGRVWNTLNYGGSWTNVSPFPANPFYVTRVLASPNNSSSAYVTRSGYRENDNTPLVFKTTNNGGAWTNISGNLPALAVNDILVYPGDENTIFIANDAGVYYTEDAGLSWSRLGNNMPYVAVLDIHFNYNNTRIIAGTFGRSIYSTNISTITGVQVLTHAVSINVYPNPFTDVLTVNCEEPFNSLKLFAMNGNLVLTSTMKTTSVAHLSAGVYIAEIDVNGEISRKQVVKR